VTSEEETLRYRADIRQEVGELRGDMKAVQRDLLQLRGDVAAIKQMASNYRGGFLAVLGLGGLIGWLVTIGDKIKGWFH
jgi:hypothetical protein